MSENDKGLIRIPNAPIMTEASWNATMVDQFLFGEHFTILQESLTSGWFLVQNHFSNNRGWIHEELFYPMSDDLFNEITSINQSMVKSPFAELNLETTSMIVPMGSLLPIAKNELFPLKNINIYGETIFESEMGGQQSRSTRVEFFSEICKSLLNVPYLKGGKTYSGLDPEGLVSLTFRLLSIRMYRELFLMESQGHSIKKEELDIGDLIYFSNENKMIKHVGISIGGEKVLHVDYFVTQSRIDESGIIQLKRKNESLKVHSIKRLIQ